MPLIKHTEEFLEKQRRRKIAIEALEKKQAQEIVLDRHINLITQETELKEELKTLDSTSLEDRFKFYELQKKAFQEGIPLVKFFSKYQYEAIFKMIRALRLYNDIARKVFDSFDINVFRETEEIIAICKSNIEHLKVLEDFGEITYKEQYKRPIASKKRKASGTGFKDIRFDETPEQIDNKVKDFMTSFNKSKTNSKINESEENE